ncbi:hypothetical protein Scani_27110 [Streptomyces caniferus]|uniref:Uncharacterized protein n=1 Tax=Streptomyces caniferus TaxID=285557 RepID=A0A640S4L1_9ACTN|nr:hypothetical protein Scani_27110 [Streptomyces caniferus]
MGSGRRRSTVAARTAGVMVSGALRERIGPSLRRLCAGLQETAEHDGEKYEITGTHAPNGQRCPSYEASTPA